ncbi:MAG: peptide ABC transporter ATP-binding protein [Chloroflexi bacterium]|nr:peptide ABC transporter ATP-binding protein [Chloroflexota bacterium]|tara:strand:+ start:3881 stop:4897 length:1017 start_codon:yes stop_codon:yes gene_type:complete
MTTKNKKDDSPILEVTNLKKYFPIQKGIFKKIVGNVRAVDGVDFSINKGETVSLVGESGCGKTTTARCIMRALDPTSGEIKFKTKNNEIIDLSKLSKDEVRPYRDDIQMIFQDPFSSLNPRMTLFDIVGEPLLVNGMKAKKEREERVSEIMHQVGLRPEYMMRFPHAFSGGQRQRIGIARALSINPSLIVADEPVSALDVSVQAQVLNLMMDLQDQLNLTYLFVSHDLSVVSQISDRVIVMYVGKIVESGTPKQIFESPKHPYTSALLSSVPKADPRLRQERIVLKGEVANAADPPSGCTFRTRCPNPTDDCRDGNIEMGLIEVSPGHWVDQCCVNCG